MRGYGLSALLDLQKISRFGGKGKGEGQAIGIGYSKIGSDPRSLMKRDFFRRLWMFLLIILRFRSSVCDSSASENLDFSLLSHNSQGSAQIGGRSLLSLPLKHKSNTALIAALDGEIHLVDNNSMKKIWSFTSGPPIYSSYQAPMKYDESKENASGSSSSPFFFDCGDDWELYMHTEHGRVKLPKTIDEVVRSTPYIFEDGAVMTGIRKSTVFEIDPATGRLIRIHTNDLPSFGQSNEERSVLNGNKSKNNGNSKDLIEPGLMNPIEPRLYITRKDYSLKTSFPGSEEVSWSLSVSEIEAIALCPDIENPTQGALWNLKNISNFEVDFDFAMPVSCQSKAIVFRERNYVVSESSGYKSLSEAHITDGKLSSGLMLHSPSKGDKHFNIFPEKLMLPGPASNITFPVQPNASSSLDDDSKAALPMPLMKINASRIVPGHKMGTPNADLLSMFLNGLVGLFFVFFTTLLVGLITFGRALAVKLRQFFLKGKPPITYDSKIESFKRKKTRKFGRRFENSEKNDVLDSSENEDMHISEGLFNNWFHHENLADTDGSVRRINRLLVTNTEIAKGSNGTIVLEGKYNGRAVAVKRLNKTHHDVAYKEVENLIASDRHPNIVRWYGVEFDQHFVYLALERCSCSLDDLIQIFSNTSLNSMFSLDQDSGPMIEYKLRLEVVKNVMPDLKLWKENSRPSPLLLKLMRDMVAGLKHLHDLGIIHRDLKPQNVLIDKGDILCAKLSDMGISKRLLADMSSLGHHATGYGSSGWQAPEQLLHGRQTRAVDLFSLGCVLFFCITGGKHPFGDRFERDANIVKNQMDLFLVDDFPEAVDLISRLLNPEPDLRPKASEVLQHPFFWSCETRLDFLRDLSDTVELEDRKTDSSLLKALENTAPLALGGRWDEKMESVFITNIGRYRRYKYDSVRDLLRVMRNKLNHYGELPTEIQALLGSTTVGFDDYFARRFPKLLIEVYKVVSQYCREEDKFQKYFSSHVEQILGR